MADFFNITANEEYCHVHGDDMRLKLSEFNTECYDMRYEGVLNESYAYFGPLFLTKPYFVDAPVSQRSVLNPENTMVNLTIDGVPLTAPKGRTK